MPVYFASDVHLRLDRPDRGRRFGRWVDGLRGDDPLTIVGDLCDFWFAARERRADPMACAGLRALADFRARGGALTVLLGNHDTWLGPLYESALGARIVAEPLAMEVDGLSIHLVHGHRVGARPPWKALLESRAFLAGFGLLPNPLARVLQIQLDATNERSRIATERHHVARFRRIADALDPAPDLAVFGHSHSPVDDASTSPRLIVLGGWLDGGSYLKIDDGRATLVSAASEPVGERGASAL